MSLFRRFSVVSFLFFFFVSDPQAATQERPALIQVEITSLEQFQNLLVLGLDVIDVQPGKFAEILVSDADMQILSQAGYKYKIIQQDMVAHLKAGLSGQADMGGYHTMDEIYAAMDSIHSENPSITSARESVGYTIQGRVIYAMKISDNPEIDEDEPEVFYNSLTHAREPMGMEVLLYFMRYLTNNYGFDTRVDSIVNNREIWFIPLVNPDGYEFNNLTVPEGGGLWRKNRRNNGGGIFGVDLNRNFGHKWGLNDIGSSPTPSSEIYRGTGPFSEPETQAIRNFVLSHDLVITINYHTYGYLLLYSWGYTPFHPPDRLVFEMVAEAATVVNNYTWGPSHSTLYATNGGVNDWMYGEQSSKKKIISFLPEVGFDFWPPEEFIPSDCSDNLEANLYLSEIAGYLYNRSFRCLKVEPIYIDAELIYMDSTEMLLKVVNQDSTSPVTLLATDHDSSYYPLAVSAWEEVSSEKNSLSAKNGNSVSKNSANKFEFNTVPDWLKITPESSAVVLSNDSITFTLKLTTSSLNNVNKIYDGEIVIASYNNRMSGTQDTTIIPVKFQVRRLCLAKTGDVTGDNTYNLQDVISLVNIVFKGASKPSPDCRADANADTKINLSDLIFLVNKIFKGGPNPPVIGFCCL